MRLPNTNDLKSDTVKTASAIGLLSVVMAVIQIGNIYGWVSDDFLQSTQTANPYITLILSWLVATFRANYKTDLNAP